jgi:phosphatidylglycerophosphate synthase
MSAPAAPSRWLTRANALTALRLSAVPFLALAIAQGASVSAAALFTLAVATDLLDGRVARRFGETSALGGLLDHATDAAFVTAGLGALAWQGEIPFLLPSLVAIAFVQYAFDSRWLGPAAGAGRPALHASALGRLNGIAYFVPLGAAVVRDALGLGWPPASLVYALGALLAATTLLSIADRAWALWRALRG